MTILLLKNYNNYFNRIVKQEADVATYKTKSTSYLEYNNVNFDPKDGIATTLVVGNDAQQREIPSETPGGTPTKEVLKFDELGSPDYLVCHENNVIKSRWFVLECVKVRQGQFKLALKRDLMVDFYNQIMKAPCYIEKGSITDVNNPLLVNPEGMSFNQIKQSEDYIKDDSKCAWLVGYVKKDIDSNDLQNVNPINYTTVSATASIIDAEDFTWESCIQYIDTKGQPVNNSHKNCFYFYNSDISFRTWYNPSYFSVMTGNVRLKFTENYQKIYSSTDYPNEDWGKLNSTAFDIPENYKVNDSEASSIANKIFTTTRDDEDCRNKFETMIATGKASQFSADTVLIGEDIFKYNGAQIVKDNKVYQLEISPGQSTTTTQYLTGEDSTALTWMTTVASKIQHLNYNTDHASRKKIRIDYRGKDYQIIAREIVLGETLSFNFPVSANRNGCEDATYDMFCMPIDPKALGLTVSSDPVVIKYTTTVDNEDIENVVDLSSISINQLAMATVLSTKLGGGTDNALNYDLQLLPYCPFQGLDVYYENTIYGPTYGKYVIDADKFQANDFTFIKNGNQEVQGIIFYPQKANFSTLVNYNDPNESVHYEWQTIENPVLLAQGSYDGVPQYRFDAFPYECTESVWELGPNSNNPDDSDLIIENGLTKEDCSYISLSVSTGLKKPALYLSCEDFPTPPAGQEYSYTFTGNFTIKVLAHWVVPDRPIDIKVKNECDIYRLTSPNFNSAYEFKKTKLRDGIVSFNIDCSYKPFTPYIKVNPNYGNSLYAIQDFNDNMGLICAGDFSIPMLSDAMINYELQNRNYQNIFNRQIQSLDVNQQIAKEQHEFKAILSSVGGGIGGAIGGAKAGGKVGGGWGAVAGAIGGAVAGSATSIISGVKDLDWLERQQIEAKAYATDMYNYQLGNVQALNQSITKSSPLTYNNKVWPVLELFSCTDTEKDILREKIRYNGMTVMAIGNLAEYASSEELDKVFVKGQLIRLEDLADDFHIADAIYQEVNKGFYIKGE